MSLPVTTRSRSPYAPVGRIGASVMSRPVITRWWVSPCTSRTGPWSHPTRAAPARAAAMIRFRMVAPPTTLRTQVGNSTRAAVHDPLPVIGQLVFPVFPVERPDLITLDGVDLRRCGTPLRNVLPPPERGDLQLDG